MTDKGFPVPPPGTLLPVGWFTKLVEFINSVRIIPGPGLRVNRTPGGTVLNLVPQAIPISGTSGGSSDYRNYFKVIPGSTAGTVRIVDGADPSSATAGSTDLGSVAAADLAVTSGTVYLCLTWDGSAYQQNFGTSTPSDGIAWELATVNNGAVIQRWTGGEIRWRSEFFV